MADGTEGAGFWLPSEFFTDDDFLMDKENFNKNTSAEPESQFCFSTEFPFDFLDTETEDFLEKPWVMSTSPQSTLAHFRSGSNEGSPIDVPSPQSAALSTGNDAVLDLIYRAAGRVAKLRLSGDGLPPTGPSTKLEGHLGPQRNRAQLYPSDEILHSSVFQNKQLQQHLLKQQNQRCEMLCRQQQLYSKRREGAGGVVGQAAWTIHQDPNRVVYSSSRSVLFGGSGVGAAGGDAGGGWPAVKRKCAGTGVFLPRKYGCNSDHNASDSRSKPVCSAAVVPNRASAHAFPKNYDRFSGCDQSRLQSFALSKNFDNINGGCAQSHLQSQPLSNRSFMSDYDSLMAREQAILLQRRRNALLAERSMAIQREMALLPHDWSY